MKDKKKGLYPDEITEATFKKMHEKVEKPGCFSGYGLEDINKCASCWYHPECKQIDPKKAAERIRAEEKKIKDEEEKANTAAAKEAAAKLMKDTKAGLDELKIKYKEDASYPELKKLLNDALEKE